MMFRKISETFTATHFTLLAMTAILAPSALYATVATTAVSITDPNTGQKSFVDAARRLSVYDSAAGFANNPANYVRLIASCNSNSTNVFYSPPNGKALIIKSANFYYTGGSTSTINYLALYNSGVGTIAVLTNTSIVGSQSNDFGTGWFVANGESIGLTCEYGTYSAAVTGYLVPANSVPSGAAFAEQSVSSPKMRDSGRL